MSGALSNEKQAKKAALAFREEHNLGSQPLLDLITVIEQTVGIDVAVLDVPWDEHGLTMRDPQRSVTIIGIAQTSRPMRQRSTLAHELAHHIFRDSLDLVADRQRPQEEIRADAFARHLLLPAEGLKEVLPKNEPLTLQHLSDVVQRFQVSPQLAAIALRDAKYIDQTTVDDWKTYSTLQLATLHGWTDFYESLQADSNKTRAPQGLLKRTIVAYTEGVVSAQTVATVRNVPEDRVLKDFQEAGIAALELTPTDIPASSLPNVVVDLSALDD